MTTGEDAARDDVQRIVRVPGARRARLTPAPGTIAEPLTEDTAADAAGPAGASGTAEASGAAGPNDERLRRDVPPHY